MTEIDAARELGRMEYEREQLREALERAKRPHWTQRWPVVLLCFIIFAAVGVRFAPPLYGWWYGWEDGKARTEAMPTAGVSTPITRPAPTAPPSFGGGISEQSSDTQQPADDQQPPAEQAQPTVAEPSAQQEVGGIPPAGASEAEIRAWLDGPVSTPTPGAERPLVEVVSEAAFDASFQETECSPFVGYLPGDPCVEALKAGE